MNKPNNRLCRAIQLAIKNDPNFLLLQFDEPFHEMILTKYNSYTHKDAAIDNEIIASIIDINPCIIYSKEFAQAFWFAANDSSMPYKDKYVWLCYRIFDKLDDDQRVKMWQYHQMQMILADDPLEYLESFL